MNKRSIIVFLLISTVSICTQAQVNFDGLWGGSIKSGGLEIEVNFKVESEANRVLLTVPLQKISDQVGSGIEIKGDSIFFDYSNFNASYAGKYDEEMEEIVGHWTQ